MPAYDIMVDLETMGNGNKAAIVSIGAVAFDRSGVYAKFYQPVFLQSSVDAGMDIDASTVMWWLTQDEAARKELTQGMRTNLYVALTDLAIWMREHGGEKPSVWGNGATFDNVILANAYALCKIDRPWRYSGDRCYRTMKNLAPAVKVESVGVAHNAVDDAEYQANHLIAICKHLNISL